MDNGRTLMLLVRAWANRLERELEILDRELPKGLERHRDAAPAEPAEGQRGFLSGWGSESEASEGASGALVVLDGLYSLLDELREAEDMLDPSREPDREP